MRAVIQRVSKASVIIDNHTLSRIEFGFLILLGVEINDTKEDALWLAQKISKLRLFADNNDNMNRSIIEIQGDILVVSQFTLHANKKRKSTIIYKAAKSESAILLYKKFIVFLEEIIQKL